MLGGGVGMFGVEVVGYVVGVGNIGGGGVMLDGGGSCGLVMIFILGWCLDVME